MRLAIVVSHPIQYHSPIFRALSESVNLHVFYAYQATTSDQAEDGFGVKFDWDIDLLEGFESSFLENVSKNPGLGSFGGCDTPSIGDKLDSRPFDAVLLMGWHLKIYIQSLFAAKKRGIPVMVRGDSQVQTPRSFSKRLAKSLAYPVFLRLFDAALYVGVRSKEYYTHYHYPENRLFFSPHCVDNDWFAEKATKEESKQLRTRLGIKPDVSLVLFAGKLVQFKRPLDVIEATHLVRQRGFEVAVLVAGAGELEEIMKMRADELDVPIYHLGFCNQTEMPAAYAAADVLALPSSSSETWGLVANEALACGCPIVVSSACGCAPDLTGDGMVGRSYPFNNIQAFSDALYKMLESSVKPADMTTKLKTYSPTKAADGVCEALDYLTGR